MVAVAIMVLNDWVLKPRWPGTLLTGKLSDVAGLAAAPVILSALIGLGLHVFRRDGHLTHRRLVACVVATAAGFAAVKLVPPVATAVARLIGHGASFYPDWTDLFAIPAVLVAYAVGRAEIRRYSRREQAVRAPRGPRR